LLFKREKILKKVLHSERDVDMVMSKGRDGDCAWCVASKNIRAISRSHPRLKATERSEVTLEYSLFEK